MITQPIYILDSDVFIGAKNSYYNFNICPGFWDSLIYHCKSGRIYSIDKVKKELYAGDRDEDLLKWISNNIPKKFFLTTNDQSIKSEYKTIIDEINNCSKYEWFAKKNFARGADCWLIACAKVNGFKVVTNEGYEPRAKRKIKIPNVCEKFSVDCQSPFAMLEELQTEYHFLEGSDPDSLFD